MQDGLLLSFNALAGLSAPTRKELLELIAGRINVLGPAGESASVEPMRGGAKLLEDDGSREHDPANQSPEPVQLDDEDYPDHPSGPVQPDDEDYPDHPSEPVQPDDESDGLAQFAVGTARQFLERVGDRVYRTVRAIAEADRSGCKLSEIRRALGAGEDDSLAGIIGGITKRTRTVVRDPEAELVWWYKDGTGEWVGRMGWYTHHSFRLALGIPLR